MSISGLNMGNGVEIKRLKRTCARNPSACDTSDTLTDAQRWKTHSQTESLRNINKNTPKIYLKPPERRDSRRDRAVKKLTLVQKKQMMSLCSR